MMNHSENTYRAIACSVLSPSFAFVFGIVPIVFFDQPMNSLVFLAALAGLCLGFAIGFYRPKEALSKFLGIALLVLLIQLAVRFR